MKKILFALILIAALSAAAPFVSGQRAEVVLDQWVDYINSGGNYEASWDYYNKSWLSTDAVLLVKLKSPLDLPLGEGFAQDWILPLHISMNHGPLLIKDNYRQGWFSGKVQLSQEHEGWIKDHVNVAGDGPFYTSNLHMDLQGNLHINDHSLPFTVEDEGEVISVEGYQGWGELTLNKKIKYSGLLPSVVLSGGSGNIVISDIDFKLTSNLAQKYGQYLVPGEGSFSFKSINATFPKAPDMNFLLNGANAKSSIEFNPNGSDARFNIELGFKKLEAMGDEMTDASFVMDFDRLSLSFMDKYLGMIQEFGSIAAENTTMMALQMSSLAASDLIPAGPKISISKLNFSTPEGHLKFSGDIEVSPDAANKISNPMAMISDITINASTEMDKALAVQLTNKSTLKEINNQLLLSGEEVSESQKNEMVEQQSAMQLSMLVIQGMLIEKDEKYTSKFQFKDGAALLNDQPVPLPF